MHFILIIIIIITRIIIIIIVIKVQFISTLTVNILLTRFLHISFKV